jgi:hypothetical protein
VLRGVKLGADALHGQAAPGRHVPRVPAVHVLVAHSVGDRLLTAGQALEHRDHLPLPPHDVREDLAHPPGAAARPPHRLVAQPDECALECAEVVVGLPQEVILQAHGGELTTAGPPTRQGRRRSRRIPVIYRDVEADGAADARASLIAPLL